MNKRQQILMLALLLSCSVAVRAAPMGPDVDRIYQFFVPSAEDPSRPNLGAYLWVPPNTPRIRAVLVGMHNGLPIHILQSAPVRAACRKHGVAQILLTPWAKDIGEVMLKNLTYDVTDPARTAVYDGYLARLAEVSGHPELITAPIVPLGHSAFCDFPFDAAIRRPEQCLGAIPIKAGLPDVYNFYAVGGKAKSPDPSLCLRGVPILFVHSASQETVVWSAYPHGMTGAGMGSYRRDSDDNPGTGYKPRDELFGMSWEMTGGHFDMLPRDDQFVADWLDAVAEARLPEKAGSPLKDLTLRDGWLMCPQIPAAGDLPNDYPMPAPYLQYKGRRSQALWYPNEGLARNVFELGRDEPRKQIELFTFLDGKGQPISLAHGAMATMPDPRAMLYGDGLFTLTTHHFTAPPDICTITDKDHLKHPEQPHVYANVLFPGKTVLPTSEVPLHFDPDAGALELVRSERFKDERGAPETRFTLRLVRHRIDPDAGFTMSFVRVYHQGDGQFAAAGRTCQIAWGPSDADKTASAQTVDFPPVPDAPASSAKVELHARSSCGLPVDYFVLKGPGVIRDDAFVPAEFPAGATRPIEVTVGAYQVGLFRETGGVRPSQTVYQTFHLTPAAEGEHQ
jgi:hypothetical protein